MCVWLLQMDVELLLSWLDLLLCANHAHIHRDYWNEGKSLKHDSRILQLFCCCCADSVY